MSAARLTINQAAAAFGVTTMTIFSWRKGVAGREPLPVEIENPDATKPRVFVPIKEAKAWATKHSLEFKPESIESKGRQTKPGPKAKPEQKHKTRRGLEAH